MPKEVIMPALGMSQDTGRLIAWLKEAGDTVEKGEPIMEIETDKTTVEVDAPASGTLANVRAQAGEDVPVGDVIALILAPGEQAPVPEAPPAPAAPAPEVAEPSSDGERSATPVAVRVAAAHDIDLSQVPSQSNRVTRADVEAYLSQKQTTSAPARADGHVLASPKARRLAAERGVELRAIIGSGPDGAVLAEDVLAYRVPATEAPTGAHTTSEEVSIQTGTMWRRMAERLTESWQTVPHFYLKRDVSATAMMAWRKSALERSPVKVTYTDLLVKLVASALREHSFVNGTWTGQGVAFNEQINIGLAVAVDEGLLVPVIHDADQHGLVAIAERRQEIVSRAMEGKLKPADLQGGTFTISNLGMFGIDEFEAIVNPPQAAILAVGRIFEKVLPVEGDVEVVPTMTLRLSCDHRAVDGARGARFLDTLAQRIADPLSLMD